MTAVADSALGRAADIVLLHPRRAGGRRRAQRADHLHDPADGAGRRAGGGLLERRGFKPQDFRVFHPGGKLGAMLRTVGDLMHGVGELPLVAPTRR